MKSKPEEAQSQALTENNRHALSPAEEKALAILDNVSNQYVFYLEINSILEVVKYLPDPDFP